MNVPEIIRMMHAAPISQVLETHRAAATELSARARALQEIVPPGLDEFMKLDPLIKLVWENVGTFCAHAYSKDELRRMIAPLLEVWKEHDVWLLRIEDAGFRAFRVTFKRGQVLPRIATEDETTVAEKKDTAETATATA